MNIETIKIYHWTLNEDIPLASLLPLLSKEEKSRAEQFQVEPAKRAYIICRAYMRQILGEELQQAAVSLCFKYNPDGKPSLKNHPQFGFNLSHSHDYAALACSPQSQLGIDIEKKRREVDFPGIMKSYFNPSEQQYWQKSPTAERFFQLWTAKEALIKASGEGFRRFEDFTLEINEQQTFQVQAQPNWHIRTLQLHDDYKAHLAIETSSTFKIKYLPWP